MVLLRVPSELKHSLEAEARRAQSNVNDVILRALADALVVPIPSQRSNACPSPRTTDGPSPSRLASIWPVSQWPFDAFMMAGMPAKAPSTCETM